MSTFYLKLLAVFLMLADHLALALPMPTPLYLILRCVGRLCFPIFAFCVANGYRHTKSPLFYLLRILCFAFLSEPFFDLFFHGSLFSLKGQNILFTLFFGLLCILAVDRAQNGKNRPLWALAALLSPILSELFFADGGGVCVILVVCFFAFPSRLGLALSCIAFSLRNVLFSLLRYFKNLIPLLGGTPRALSFSRFDLITLCAALAVIPLLCYNGKKGKEPTSRAGRFLFKYGFYLFYPLHLLVLYFV